MIGFDVPYGNQTFIDDGKNGYLLPYTQDWSDDKKVDLLADAVIKLFTTADQEKFIQHSYDLAEPYLTDNDATRWGKLGWWWLLAGRSWFAGLVLQLFDW